MRNTPFVSRLALICAALFMMACTRSDDTAMTDEADVLNDRLQTLYELHRYQQAENLLDSVQQTGCLPESWVKGERGCMYQTENAFPPAEELLEAALADPQLPKVSYHSYLNMAESMVANKIDMHKWEEALRLAQRVCDETRNHPSLFEQMVSLRMYAYIGSCQIRLQNWDEAKTIAQTLYTACMEQLGEHPTAALDIFYCYLALAEAYNGSTRWADAALWIDRTLEVLDHVQLFVDHPRSYDHWSAFLHAIRSVTLQHLGRADEAAASFKIFDESHFSKGLGGLNGIYYLIATEQWAKVEQMLPVVDSLIGTMGAEIIPEYLQERYGYPYLVYRNLGKTDKVLAVTDSVFKYFQTAIDNERISKAIDLAKLYETREKERALLEKDRQLAILWTGGIAVVMLLFIIGLATFVIHHRRADRRLMEEHQKLVDAYDQLMVANARAEESAKMKNAFIRQVSHEIRTPLNILSGFTQVLTNPDLTLDEETKAEASRSIVSNTHRITKLVNKMLELSDISTMAVIERTDEVLAGDISIRAVADNGIQDEAKVTFSFESDPDVANRTIRTNIRAAVRALVLLLDNARKFLGKPDEVGEGSVMLRLVADEANGMVRYIVEDTGIGVPAEEAEHIFDEFVQLNDFYTGTGIGLSVARSLARCVGGDIVLDTTYRNGARFVMSLPC